MALAKVLVLSVMVVLFIGTVECALDVRVDYSATAQGSSLTLFSSVAPLSDGDSVTCGSFSDPITFSGVEEDIVVTGAYEDGPNLMCGRFNADGKALWVTPLSYSPYNDTLEVRGFSTINTIEVFQDMSTIIITGQFGDFLVLPCNEELGDPYLCTSSVPVDGGGVAPAISFSNEYGDRGAFYAALSLVDGRAIWAYNMEKYTELNGSTSDGQLVYFSGTTLGTLTIPSVPDGAPTESQIVDCFDVCGFVCAISPENGGALWCETTTALASDIIAGAGGTALFLSGKAEDSGNHTSLIVQRIDPYDHSEVWTRSYDVESANMAAAIGLSCYNDCENVYLWGNYQANITNDYAAPIVGYVWALDQAGNNLWFSRSPYEGYAQSFLVGVESANGLYAGGNWLLPSPSAFFYTLDYSTGEVLEVSDTLSETYLTGFAIKEFTQDTATMISCGIFQEEALLMQVDITPDSRPVYPSASATPVPLPSSSPLASTVPSSPSTNVGSSGDAVDTTDDDDWVWWVVGISIVSLIIAALLVIVAGGVLYRRRVQIEMAKEDPYDYDMLSRDMFEE